MIVTIQYFGFGQLFVLAYLACGLLHRSSLPSPFGVIFHAWIGAQ
jgi:hypothetical protein